jgi:F0F1-type ATP synthase membrane subunit b/b'
MDLNEKIRELESELYEGKGVPFSKKALVDSEKCLQLLKQIKSAIPDEVYDLNRIADDRKRVLSIADQNLSRMTKMADKIISEAEQRAALIVDESHLVKAAEFEAQRVKELALRDIEEAELGARERLSKLLSGAESYLLETLSMVKKSRIELGTYRGEENV